MTNNSDNTVAPETINNITILYDPINIESKDNPCYKGKV